MNSDPSVNTIQSTKLKDETKKEFKKKLALYNELHTQQRKIKSEMSELKAILIQYFESVDEFREKKYQIGETTISYNCRRTHQGLSQRFLKMALEKYIIENKVNINSDLLMDYILSQRSSKITADLVVKIPKSDDNEEYNETDY